MKKLEKKWIWICIFGGLLMLIFSVTGSASFFALIFAIAAEHLGAEAALVLSIILVIFAIVALGGGISVILGACLVSREKFRIGKLIIGLGAGMGLIGLIIFLVLCIWAGTPLAIISFVINGSVGLFGVLLTIFARLKMKKDK